MRAGRFGRYSRLTDQELADKIRYWAEDVPRRSNDKDRKARAGSILKNLRAEVARRKEPA